MNYLLILFGITSIFTIFSFIKFRKLLTPNIIFSILWVLGAVVVNTNFVGLRTPTAQTNYYIIITIVMFNLSYIFFSDKNRLQLEKGTLLEIIDIDKHWGKIVSVNLLLTIVTFPYFCKMLLIFVTDSFYAVRVAAFNYIGLYEVLMSKVIFIVMFSFFNLLLMLTCLNITLRNNSKKLFYLMIFDALYFTMITGSRNFIAKFFIYMVVSYLLANTYLSKKIRIGINFILYGTIILLILNWAIRARSLASLSPLENIIVYLFGGISYFDHITNMPIFFADNQIRLYGLGTFSWIVSPVIYLLSLVNLIPNFTAEALIGDVTANGIYISSRFNFNALTTAMYPMWRDFGTIGIVFGMSFFGFWVAKSEKVFMKKKNLKTLLFLFSFIIAIFESTQLYNMLYLRFSMQVIWIYLLFGKKIIKLKF
ncbi:TPA: oligosaccharide repeat unit polymerase [Streptococcus suis]|nr:oligosaccharide repeat unit polymerase [Streptococcus suis]